MRTDSVQERAETAQVSAETAQVRWEMVQDSVAMAPVHSVAMAPVRVVPIVQNSARPFAPSAGVMGSPVSSDPFGCI